MDKHILTKEQTIELCNILSLLESSDPESIDLGIGLLEDWPFGARLYNSYTYQYSEKLGILLWHYRISKNFSWSYFSINFQKNSIIGFVRDCLEFGEFYTD